MRRAAKKDLTHDSIADGLRADGWSVMELHQAGGGIPDLCVGKFGLYACFVECKSDETKKLTEDQIRVKANWDGPYIVAWSLEDARTKLAAIFGEGR